VPMLSRMSMPGYRPSLTLRVGWVGLLGPFGAAIGVMIAWYGGLLWVLMTLTPADRAPGSRPPDLLGRLVQLLWPKGLGPLALLGAVAGVALAVHRAGVGDRSPQRWRSRVRRLGGGALGALVGVPGAALLVRPLVNPHVEVGPRRVTTVSDQAVRGWGRLRLPGCGSARFLARWQLVGCGPRTSCHAA
jgi:hypothetical protein